MCLPTFTHVGMNMHVHMCASTCVSVQMYVGTDICAYRSQRPTSSVDCVLSRQRLSLA